MTAIERTAYRRFKRTYSVKEPNEIFAPTEDEMWFAESTARTTPLRFVLLKCFHHLGYFSALADIPEVIITYMRSSVRLSTEEAPFEYHSTRTLYHHHTLIWEHLGITEYDKAARHPEEMPLRSVLQHQQLGVVGAAHSHVQEEENDVCPPANS